MDTTMSSPSGTPTTSPARKTMQMTQAQKQALIDNLQLEITDRARKLRAQYAQQAQSLRSRLEFRLHRIPTSLRKANMGELLAKYNDMVKAKEDNVTSTISESTAITKDKPASKTSSDTKASINTHVTIGKDLPHNSPAQTRGMKRKSDDFDKENHPTTNTTTTATRALHPLTNPKKRVKPTPPTTAPTTGPPATRTASRVLSRTKPPPSTILSPKTSNTRAPTTTTKATTRGPPARPAAAPTTAPKPAKTAAAATATATRKATNPKTTGVAVSAAATAAAAAKSAKRGATAAAVAAVAAAKKNEAPPAGGRRVLRTRK
ncbi:hypothetical protein MMC16_007602 [Acarospora aff. strigata]|nr:hypothetical protein [Acarospora aff. strigata]